MGLVLTQERNRKLINFLQLNSEVFTWSTSDMPRIDPSVT